MTSIMPSVLAGYEIKDIDPLLETSIKGDYVSVESALEIANNISDYDEVGEVKMEKFFEKLLDVDLPRCIALPIIACMAYNVGKLNPLHQLEWYNNPDNLHKLLINLRLVSDNQHCIKLRFYCQNSQYKNIHNKEYLYNPVPLKRISLKKINNNFQPK